MRTDHASRAALRRLFFAFLLILAVSWHGRSSLGEASDPVTLALCRANVSPCQTELSFPVNGAVAVDLVLAGDPSTAVPAIVAWETHFVVTDPSLVGITLGGSGGGPVQEQGRGLALDGMVGLSSSSGGPRWDYFTAQNSYNPVSGAVDYSVTLIGQDTTGLTAAIQLDHHQTQMAVGRILLTGLNEGSSGLAAISAPQSPLQIITREPSSQLVPITIPTTATPTTIRVGPVKTPEVHGKLSARPSGKASGPESLPATLTFSFWRPGSVPVWRGGSDGPVATYRSIPADTNGEFRVTDVSPLLVPAGVYDLRLKGTGTLPRVFRDVAVPEAVGQQAIISIAPAYLQPGDVDGNNVVDSADIQLLRDSFGLSRASILFNEDADSNRDSIVDVQDFSSLSRNIGLSGE